MDYKNLNVETNASNHETLVGTPLLNEPTIQVVMNEIQSLKYIIHLLMNKQEVNIIDIIIFS